VRNPGAETNHTQMRVLYPASGVRGLSRSNLTQITGYQTHYTQGRRQKNFQGGQQPKTERKITLSSLFQGRGATEKKTEKIAKNHRK